MEADFDRGGDEDLRSRLAELWKTDRLNFWEVLYEEAEAILYALARSEIRTERTV